MLFLGFGSGLPFYLVYGTLSAWLRQDGIVRSTIGMLAWIGVLFTLKFLWRRSSTGYRCRDCGVCWDAGAVGCSWRRWGWSRHS